MLPVTPRWHGPPEGDRNGVRPGISVPVPTD